MTGVIEGFRWALTGRANRPRFVSRVHWIAHTFCAGLVYFQRMETTIADVV